MKTDEFLRQQIIPLAYRQLPAGELMSRAAAGDAEAYIALVCRKFPLVEGVCRGVLGPTGPSEDVALEAFVQLWRQRSKVRSVEAVDGWLAKTARNLARKQAAAQARGRAAGREWWRRSGDTANAAPPDRAAMQAEMVHKIRLAVAAQSEADQRVLWASEHCDGDAQAAEVLGLSLTGYRVRLHRARQRLRALLKKYGVTPVVAAAAAIGGIKNRAVSAVGARWTTGLGRVQLIGLAICCLAGLISLIAWATHSDESLPPPESASRAIAQAPAPDPEPVPETLREQNLRLMREVVAPKVCAAMQPLAIAGGQFKVVELDAYDSRAYCILEVNNEERIRGVGKVSRVAFYYDSYLRNSFIYFDATGTGKWQWVDLHRPVVLFIVDKPKRWELSMKLPALDAAVKAFEELPKDPRGQAEADRRWIAMRDRSQQYVGKWYRDGDPNAEARVDIDEYLNLRFYWPGKKGIYNQVLHPWRAELGSRAKVNNEDGYLASCGIHLSADGQTLTFDGNEPPWHRTPTKK